MGLGRNTKLDVNAMEAKLERTKKADQMKERMKKNMILKQQKLVEEQLRMNQQQQTTNTAAISDEQLISIFSTGEKVERTPRKATINTSISADTSTKSSKKKKGKK